MNCYLINSCLRPQEVALNQFPDKTTEKPKTLPLSTPKNLKKVSTVGNNLFDSNLVVGNIVEHTKFGKGEVVKLEGTGSNKKAEINFNSVGTKKLLLQFAKLKILS